MTEKRISLFKNGCTIFLQGRQELQKRPTEDGAEEGYHLE